MSFEPRATKCVSGIGRRPDKGKSARPQALYGPSWERSVGRMSGLV